MSRIRSRFHLARLPRASHAEVDDELRLHLELRAAELERRGWTPEAAAREAARLFGDYRSHQAACLSIDRRKARTMRRTDLFDSLRQDLAFALRSFRRRPLFTAIAIAVLTLGIGANVAVFSLANVVLLRPLPYREPDRLVVISGRDQEGSFGISENERLRYQAESRIFAGMGTWVRGSVTWRGPARAEEIRAGFVDAQLFPVLGVVPALGRSFTPDEDRPGGDAAVILSHRFWRDRTGGRPEALGRTLTIEGRPVVIVGVLPADVQLPDNFAGPPTELYFPLALSAPDPRNLHYLRGAARLAPGVSLGEARERLAVLSASLRRDLPTLPGDFRIGAVPMTESVLGSIRPGFLLLLAAVALLLLLGCTNLAGLLLARADARRRELAVRSALGAGGARLTRQLVTESAVLGAFGGLGGLGAGYLAIQALLRASPPNLPRATGAPIDGIVLVFTLGATVLTVLLAGVLPAISASRRAGPAALREARGSSGGRERHALRRALVLSEAGLAVTIAVAAGLILRSWLEVLQTDPGFEVENRLTFRLSLTSDAYPSPAARRQYFAGVAAALETLPAVRAAGAVSALPLAQRTGDWGFLIEGRPLSPEGERNPYGDWFVVTPGYFAAMGVPLLEGRRLEAADDSAHPPVVVVNQALARRYWPDGGALGARIKMTTDLDPVWRTVVGIVGDARSRGLEEAPRPEYYLPHAQFPSSGGGAVAGAMSFVVRTTTDPLAVVPDVQRTVAAIDPAVPVARLETMAHVLDSTLSARRFQLLLLGFFALSGLALLALGVYGVVSFLVRQRDREFGVRMALGADRRGILRLVLGDGFRLGVAGAILGVVGALITGRLVRGALYGVSAFDPVVLVGVPVLVVLVVLAATLIPALRAAAASPDVTLRLE